MKQRQKPATGSKALFAVLLCASSLAFAAHDFLAPGIKIDGETISSEGEFKTKSGNKYTYRMQEDSTGAVMGLLRLTQKDGTYKLSGQDTTTRVSIQATADCIIELEDGFELGSADAGQGSSAFASPIVLRTGSTVTIRTKGTARIYGDYLMPAICVGGLSDTLVSVLFLEHDGWADENEGLFAYGGYGAPAIGSMRSTANGLGVISIRGTVNAYAGKGACAIGIAPMCDVPRAKKSYINVGSATATGKCSLRAYSSGVSPAIGISGDASGFLEIYLNNGIISAIVEDGVYGGDESSAAIGTGFWSEGGCNIYVRGGEITAVGGSCGAGIGSGCESGADMSISILGGRTVAKGGANAAGIGGGYRTKTPDIYIAGGTVTASGDPNRAKDIGSGYKSLDDNVDVLVAGGSVWPVNEKYNAVFTCNGTQLVCLWTYKASASKGFQPNQDVNVLLTTENGPYGNNDIYADEDGRVYLWVPPALYKNNLFINGEKYYADARSSKYTSPTPKGQANVCIVDFDAGDGELELRDTRRFVEYGKKVGALPTPKDRKGYDFSGWYTAESGGTNIKSSTKIKKNAVYYAHWKAHTYKIAFDADRSGASGSMKTISATYGKSYVLPANKFKLEDHTFDCWWNSKLGKIEDGAKVKNLTAKDGGKVTLYGRWKRHTYTVQFYPEDGTAKTVSQTVYRGLSTALKANTFTRDGFKFVGWAKVQFGPAVYKNKEMVMNLAKKGKTKRLYAVWVPQKSWVFDTFKSDKAIITENSATVTMTVASDGKISGKFVCEEKKKKEFSFEADGFETFADNTYGVTTILKLSSKDALEARITVGRVKKASGKNKVVPKISLWKGSELRGWGFSAP